MCSKPARLSTWDNSGTDEKNTSVIAAGLLPHRKRLIEENVSLYGLSFKSGVETTKLVKNKQLLFDLVKIDKRGGCFKQKDVKGGVEEVAAADEESKEAMALVAAKLRTTPSEIAGLIGYMVRCMLAHLRIKYAAWSGSPRVCELDEIFELMSQHMDSAEFIPVTSSQQALKSLNRPMPFMNLRHLMEDDDKNTTEDMDSDTDAAPQLVAQYFDGKRAVKLYDSGETKFADKYRSNEGMAQAWWAHDGSTLDLELPATAIVDEEMQPYVPPSKNKVNNDGPEEQDDEEAEEEIEEKRNRKKRGVMKAMKAKGKKKAMKAKPKAKVKAEAVKKKAEDDEGTPSDWLGKAAAEAVGLVVRPGKKTDQTVSWKPVGKHYQMVVVTAGNCGPHTPRQMCEAIIDVLVQTNKETMQDFEAEPPAEFVKELRKKAKQFRDDLVEPGSDYS